MGENPAMSDPDLAKSRQALATMEHLVVQDIFLTETARLADVVLPATAMVEKDGTFTNTNRQVQMAHKVVEPPGDAKPDWWITTEIANRLGLDWDYSGPADIYEEMRALMPSHAGITWKRLKKEHAVTYPCANVNEPGREILFAGGFPTPSGRAKLVAVDYAPPQEVADADFPFILITGRMLEHWHTGVITRHAEILSNLEPSAVASLNPVALSRLGLKAGEMVKVTSRRGEITLAARADQRVPEDVVFVPFCFTEAPANLLTSSRLDPFGKIPEFKYSAVRVEKA